MRAVSSNNDRPVVKYLRRSPVGSISHPVHGIIIVRCLAILILIATAAVSIPIKDAVALDKASSGEALAARVIALLGDGKFSDVARLHHFPPQYSAKERKQDLEAVERSLRFIFDRSGSPTEVRKLEVTTQFYFLASGGGDVPYWESISPYGRADYPFEVKFKNFGTGMIKPVVFLGGPNPGTELVGIEIGLPVQEPGAKTTIVDLSVDMFKVMGVPTPPNIRDLVEQGINSATVAPASIP